MASSSTTTATMFHACKKRVRGEEVGTSSYSSSPAAAATGVSRLVGGATLPFRDNIRQFLKECGEQTRQCSVAGFPTWCTSFVSDENDVLFSLYIVEEDVRKSARPACDGCRCVGWSYHFVSKRRYHLIIPREGEWTKPMDVDTFEHNTHLLHGMIHCNGFGHLLCINGKDEGSSSINAEEIMNLWDRICSVLQTRKITVQDLSKKGPMDLRLLYGAAYGRPWFAKWGYKFCRGSFGVTEDKYNRAIEIVCSLELDSMAQDLSGTGRGKDIQHVISTYREASQSSLVTISDLLQSMLVFRSKPQLHVKTEPVLATSETVSLSNLSNSATREELNSRWPVRRLEHAAKVIANTLKNYKAEFDGQSMSRQALRDAVRLYIGDTGLIDFVIKHIDNTVVGDQIIRRKMKPRTKTLEFTVEDAGGKQQKLGTQDCIDSHTVAMGQNGNLYKDVLCLYENVLFGYSESHPVSSATQVILDSKHFIKEWPSGGANNKSFASIMCKVMPGYEDLVSKLTRPLPPLELVVVPQCPAPTIEDLKLAIQKALRDTYFITDQFLVTEVRVSDLDVNSEAQVLVRGSGLDLVTELRYEGGSEDWMVDCICGARDDDGERMVACDVCEVWQHTLCNSIEDDEDVPPMFICGRCNRGKNKVRSD